MKNRKKFLYKLFTLSFGVATLATVPIITMSCNSNNQINNKTPNLLENSSLNIKYTDLFSEEKPVIQQSLEKYLSDSSNVKKLLDQETLKNFNDSELNSLTATLNTKDLNEKLQNNSMWGTTNYEDWTQEKRTWYTYQPKEPLNIDFETGFINVLNNKEILSSIIKESNFNSDENAIFSLNENNKPYIEDNVISVGVDVNKTANGSETIIVNIPFSSVIFNIKNININIKSSNKNISNLENQQVNLNLSAGVASISPFKDSFPNTITLPNNMTIVNAHNVMKAFGINTNDDENSTTINNETMSQLLSIYNVTYSEFKVVQIKTGTTIGQKEYDGKFNISVKATLNSSYVWDDGTMEPKTISFNEMLIKVKVANWKELNNQQNNWTQEIKLSSLDQSGVDSYFSDGNNLNKFLNAYQTQLETNKSIEYVNLAFISAKWVGTEQQENKIELKLSLIPKSGCDFVTGKSTTNNTFTAYITNVGQQNQTI